MYRIVLLLVILLIGSKAMCQPALTLPVENGKALPVRLGMIPDPGYSVQKLSGDTTLHFLDWPDSLTIGRSYWLKITVENPNVLYKNYVVNIHPHLQNILFYFNPDSRKWFESRTDDLNNTGSRLVGRHLVSFAGQRTTTVFVKADLKGFGHQGRKVRLNIAFQPEQKAAAHEQNILIAWVCCLVVLLIFMLNNLYLYFSLHDKTILYYLMTQLGGMIYITGYRWIFLKFLPVCVFYTDVQKYIIFYELNRVIVHLAIVMTLLGMTGMTRLYLDTRNRLPRLDRLLRFTIGTYSVLTGILVAFNMAGFSLEYYTMPYDNVFCAVILLLILITATIAYRHKLPLARPFLLAYGIPLLLMLAIPLSHLLVALQNTENLWIPEMAVLTQTLALSVAMVSRNRAVQQALSTVEIDNRQLEFSLKEADYQAQVSHLEMARMNAEINAEKIKNELLKERLETHQRELASSALHMVQKNELLHYLKSQMQVLSRPNPGTAQGMRAMSSLIDKSALLDADWQKFKMHFDQIHPHFFEDLETKHPQLTMKETRLYAYLHMKLSHKEIATLLNIDPASVRRSKTRLFKKMAIPETE